MSSMCDLRSHDMMAIFLMSAVLSISALTEITLACVSGFDCLAIALAEEYCNINNMFNISVLDLIKGNES